jgi:hypothetical protein
MIECSMFLEHSSHPTTRKDDFCTNDDIHTHTCTHTHTHTHTHKTPTERATVRVTRGRQPTKRPTWVCIRAGGRCIAPPPAKINSYLPRPRCHRWHTLGDVRLVSTFRRDSIHGGSGPIHLAQSQTSFDHADVGGRQCNDPTCVSKVQWFGARTHADAHVHARTRGFSGKKRISHSYTSVECSMVDTKRDGCAHQKSSADTLRFVARMIYQEKTVF